VPFGGDDARVARGAPRRAEARRMGSHDRARAGSGAHRGPCPDGARWVRELRGDDEGHARRTPRGDEGGRVSYVVTVVFVAKPGHRDDVRREMVANATASRTREPGCRQFDVCESADGGEIFLYEIYEDEAAFQAHLATDHYKRFNST